VDGFLDANAIKTVLEKAHLYPLGRPMAQVSAREIEETLQKNPFIETAECYKTQSGHVCIRLKQRMPVVHVMANNNENYYVDTNGGIMPETRVATDNIIATGNISKKYAQKYLAPMANIIIQDKFWQSQIEQINVLADGSIEVVPRVGEHIVYLGQPDHLQHKLTRLEKFYKYGLSKAGWNKYSYINLEFNNQIICKKVKNRNVYTAQSEN
jgi:cell division protein FtsQ